MTLTDRLERLQLQGALPARPVAPAKTAVTASLEDLLPGAVVPIAGSSFFVETGYPMATRHGLYSLAGVASISGAALAVASRDDQMRYFDARSAVFFDTETTGLSLGTGTYVFLVGAGWLDGDLFRVRQYFLGRPGDEPAMLDALAELVSGFGAVVSFNGKAFDWPILESRYVYQRRRIPLADPLHLDLLHSARRLWRRRLESCSLGSLETAVLGVERTQDDVPGWEIPSLYFRYQRTGNGQLLQGVFYHNLVDVLSLATLATHVHRVVDGSQAAGGHPLDWYSLGRLYDAAGQFTWAARCLEEALSVGLEREERIDALTRLGVILRRERRWPEAVAVWERLVDEGGAAALTGLVEIAKFYEHVDRDYQQALDVVRQAMLMLDVGQTACGDDLRAALHHRLARLVNRSMTQHSRRGR